MKSTKTDEEKDEIDEGANGFDDQIEEQGTMLSLDGF